MFSHFIFSVPTGGAAAEEQEVRVAEAALQAAQACGGGLLPHGSALQPPQVSRLQTLEELKKTVLPPPTSSLTLHNKKSQKYFFEGCGALLLLFACPSSPSPNDTLSSVLFCFVVFFIFVFFFLA